MRNHPINLFGLSIANNLSNFGRLLKRTYLRYNKVIYNRWVTGKDH